VEAYKEIFNRDYVNQDLNSVFFQSKILLGAVNNISTIGSQLEWRRDNQENDNHHDDRQQNEGTQCSDT